MQHITGKGVPASAPPSVEGMGTGVAISAGDDYETLPVSIPMAEIVIPMVQ